LLGRQQPLEGEDLEKLKLARSRYQSMGAIQPCSIAAGNHHDRLQSNRTLRIDNAIRSRSKDFRGQIKAGN
jgi:hypothetical protein